MDIQVERQLLQCMELCSKIKTMMENDKNRYSEFIGGDLRKSYEQASETGRNKIEEMRKILLQLIAEERMKDATG